MVYLSANWTAQCLRFVPNEKYKHLWCLLSVYNQKYLWKIEKNKISKKNPFPSWKVFSRDAVFSVCQVKTLFTYKGICIDKRLMLITK